MHAEVGITSVQQDQQTQVPLRTFCLLLLVLPLEGANMQNYTYGIWAHMRAGCVFAFIFVTDPYIERYSSRSSFDFIHPAPKWHIPSLVGNLFVVVRWWRQNMEQRKRTKISFVWCAWHLRLVAMKSLTPLQYHGTWFAWHSHFDDIYIATQ